MYQRIRKIRYCVIWLLCWASFLYADDLQLNGVASHEVLRRELYIGALYLPTLEHNSEVILAHPGRVRMELRILADRWSPRGFAELWNPAININNDVAALNKWSNQIGNFTNVLPESLVYGDQLVINFIPKRGTFISVNGTQLLNIKGDAFFPLLLRTWIGLRPPSSDFKDQMLTLVKGTSGEDDLQQRFEATVPSGRRRAEVAAWITKSSADSIPRVSH